MQSCTMFTCASLWETSNRGLWYSDKNSCVCFGWSLQFGTKLHTPHEGFSVQQQPVWSRPAIDIGFSAYCYVNHLSGHGNWLLGCWTNTPSIQEDKVSSERKFTSAFPQRHISGDRLCRDRKDLAKFVETWDIMVDRFIERLIFGSRDGQFWI